MGLGDDLAVRLARLLKRDNPGFTHGRMLPSDSVKGEVCPALLILGENASETPDYGGIPSARKQIDGCDSLFHSDGDGDADNDQVNYDVLPAVQIPLPRPRPIDTIAERHEVGNRPLIVVRSPPTDDVAEEVDVKGGRGQGGAQEASLREPGGNDQVNQTGSQIMSANMMDATIEIRRQTEVIGHIADTIQVGCQPGECDQNAFAPGEIDRVRA